MRRREWALHRRFKRLARALVQVPLVPVSVLERRDPLSW